MSPKPKSPFITTSLRLPPWPVDPYWYRYFARLHTKFQAANPLLNILIRRCARNAGLIEAKGEILKPLPKQR